MFGLLACLVAASMLNLVTADCWDSDRQMYVPVDQCPHKCCVNSDCGTEAQCKKVAAALIAVIVLISVCCCVGCGAGLYCCFRKPTVVYTSVPTPAYQTSYQHPHYGSGPYEAPATMYPAAGVPVQPKTYY